ncbi:MAG: S41 family peptidase [Patescibacteria group bacterium]
MISSFQNIKKNTAFIVIVLLFFGVGFYAGKTTAKEKETINLTGTDVAVATQADFSPFWEVWNTINEKYPNAKNVSDQDRVYGAISGLVGSLGDPYSTFFKPDEKQLFEDDIAGNFTGVGMEVAIKDKVLTIIAPLKDTPAYKAGLQSGDKVLKIDGITTLDMPVEKAIKMIRGEKGTTVTLSVFHEGDKEPREIKIIRDTINVPTLDTELRPDGIFVIKLYSFSANSADLFRKALKEFSESKTDKLVLDLRGNPGGYLEAAVDMASWFLPSGKTVVIEDYGNNTKESKYRSRGYNVFSDSLKFVILINGGSASASEILAGAMQDYKKAKLVGETSFGKGSVQEVVDITPDTILKITIAKWLTPNGKSISEKGLTPDYEVPFTRKDAENKQDPQLNKAVELLNNWQ